MRNKNEETYPDCPIITRTLEVGGLTKQQLIQRLQEYSILINEYGEKLLNDKKFTTSVTEILTEEIKRRRYQALFYMDKMENLNKSIKESNEQR